MLNVMNLMFIEYKSNGIFTIKNSNESVGIESKGDFCFGIFFMTQCSLISILIQISLGEFCWDRTTGSQTP